eukprot:2651104-Rhodomonas_salina.1
MRESENRAGEERRSKQRSKRMAGIQGREKREERMKRIERNDAEQAESGQKAGQEMRIRVKDAGHRDREDRGGKEGNLGVRLLSVLLSAHVLLVATKDSECRMLHIGVHRTASCCSCCAVAEGTHRTITYSPFSTTARINHHRYQEQQ